jgi:hypothetical protein
MLEFRSFNEKGLPVDLSENMSNGMLCSTRGKFQGSMRRDQMHTNNIT